MEAWISFWEIICALCFVCFYVLVLFIIPFGAKDILALLRHLKEKSKEN
jgi:hypothetical protein